MCTWFMADQATAATRDRVKSRILFPTITDRARPDQLEDSRKAYAGAIVDRIGWPAERYTGLRWGRQDVGSIPSPAVRTCSNRKLQVRSDFHSRRQGTTNQRICECGQGDGESEQEATLLGDYV